MTASAIFGMLVKDFVHLAGIDIEPAGDDHVLFAVHDIDVAVFVRLADIAGVEPAVLELVCGFLRIVPVALHDGRALDDDFAGLARLDVLSPFSISTRRTSFSMSGTPMEPVFCPRIGLLMPEEVVSLMPQPSLKKMPMSFTLWISSAGMGAPPELIRRMRLPRFSSAALGWLTMAVIMVGTAGK